MTGFLKTTAKFLFCAIPGAALLFFVGPACLLEGFFHDRHRALLIVAGFASILTGAPLILYGTDRWGQWGYLLPLFSVPVVVLAYGEQTWRLIFIAVPFVLAAVVHQYYKRKAA